MERPNGPSEEFVSSDTAENSSLQHLEVTLPVNLENDEAQIDPRGLAPKPKRKNATEQRTRTSLLFVLFEYAMESGIIELKFIDQCSTIWRLDKFTNASFHSHFQLSVAKWRQRLSEDQILRNRLLKQHSLELEKLTYPLPKNRGKLPQRKRGYRDKGSTRPFHKRGRTDKETTISVYFEDLYRVEKIRCYGRRPTVTYRRLPYSEVIREAIEANLLERVGDFYVPCQLKED